MNGNRPEDDERDGRRTAACLDGIIATCIRAGKRSEAAPTMCRWGQATLVCKGRSRKRQARREGHVAASGCELEWKRRQPTGISPPGQ